ncbi:MAG: cobalt transporter, permease protein CbiQ [Actinobacteria bacterium]|nr:cobalt transporter, permease protein CbiQ [Actinomycetota bacterium]
MHIPDGYLSPVTCAALYAADLPVWAVAAKRVNRVVKTRDVPLLAVGAAFCFLTMMFNVPVPGGTTAHAVGAVLVAILLGPSAAIIAVSAALAVQALFFGDGGVLALGANVFNMAVVMTLAGYGIYRLLARGSGLASPRRALAAGLGAYAGLNAAALCAAVELGLQPALFHAADGTPLYAPFHLSQALPPVMLAHLTVAGGVELAMTLGIVAYLQRANLPLLAGSHPRLREPEPGQAPRRRTGWRWGLAALGAMAVLTPLGLLASGGAFGEAKPGQLDLARYHLKAVPAGLRHYAGVWHHALLDGYGFAGGSHPVIGYLVSAAAGAGAIAAVFLAVFAFRRWMPRPVAPAEPAGPPVSSRAGAVPAWLLAPQVDLAPGAHAGGRRGGGRRAGFVDKTLNGAAAVMRQAIFAEDTSQGGGLLQRIDARIKVVSVVALLVAAGLVRHIPVLLVLYAGALALAAASRIPLGFFVRRVWLFIPIFTGIVVLPATLSIVTPGHIQVHLGHWWFGHEVGITSQGLLAAGLIVTRVAVSISLVVLLTLTTPWSKLLAALRALFVPRIFVVVLGMCYRYIFHLLNAVTDMYTARKARGGGRRGGRQRRDVAAGRSLVAASAGALFGKASALSEEVHMAMTSRGYTGNIANLGQRRLHAIDLAWGLTCVAVAVAALGGDRVLGR